MTTSLPSERSRQLFEEAQRLMPGGVSSPVRAFRAVGGTPRFIVRGKGARVWDADDNVYLDYVCSWGPLIAGHAHPGVVAAVQQAAAQGTSYGMPTPAEVALARQVGAAFPSIEMVRFVSSGTEATMSALRLARACTGREMVVKFDGGYHGHVDSLLVHAGSGPLTLGLGLGLASSPGVPAAQAALTLSVPYNDVVRLAEALESHPGQVAAVIVEPVAGNMGVVPPAPGFLQHVRDLTRQAGALLIFDEVITGFRVAPGGAQQLYAVVPDLTCLGKVLGGGLPVGAYGGRRELMERVAPVGSVYQAGTLSGNPLALAAGLATLELLHEKGVYDHLERLAGRLAEGLSAAAAAASVPVTINRVGSLLTVFFTPAPVVDEASARRSDTRQFALFFQALLRAGILLPPSQFEALFLSLAHTQADVDDTVTAAAGAFRAVARGS